MKRKSLRTRINVFFGRLREFPYILRALWFIALFQTIVLVAFWLLPQGQDLLLAIMEDITRGDLLTFVWFVLAVIYLSATSEFGSRFVLYLSDTSTHDLSRDQVRYRKYVAKTVAKVVLFIPVMSAYGGFLIAYLSHFGQDPPTKEFLIITITFGVVAALLYHAYLGWFRERFYALYLKKDHLRYRSQISALAKLYSIFKHRTVEPIQAARVNAITGIAEAELIATGFKPKAMFYGALITRFWIFFTIAVVCILLFSFLPIAWYQYVGSLALLTLAFGCWFTIYYSVELVDRIKPLGLKFSYKLLLILWLLTVSCLNDDHPVRPSDTFTSTMKDSRKSVMQEFEEWVKSTGVDTAAEYPVVLIAAEGGALRTGCFTSMMLSQIQDAYPDFKDKIFCYSSVSGGTLGSGMFNGLNLIKYDKSYSTVTKGFYNHDFLAPVIGKLAFGEILGLFYPYHVPSFDRAGALEQSWEISWDEVDLEDHPNFFRKAFHQLDDYQQPRALHLINTTEVESGYRTILSNAALDSTIFIKTIDLYDKLRYPINYSTAISVSARFPLVSPAAAVQHLCLQRYHYVDGGYYENKGATTLREVLLAIQKSPLAKNAKPYVIQFNFGVDNLGDSTGLSMFSQAREIIDGIYNVRAGHTDYAKEMLKSTTRYTANGVFISLDLLPDSRKVPLNWTLSRKAVEDVHLFCQAELRKYQEELLRLRADSTRVPHEALALSLLLKQLTPAARKQKTP